MMTFQDIQEFPKMSEIALEQLEEEKQVSPNSAGTEEMKGSFEGLKFFQLKKELECIPEEEEDQTSNMTLCPAKSQFLIFEGSESFYLIVSGGVSMGRNKINDFQISNKTVSGKHCRIAREENSYYLMDSGSFNGTWLSTLHPLPVEEGMTFRLKNILIKISELNFREKQIVLAFPQLAEEYKVKSTTVKIGPSASCDISINLVKDSKRFEEIQVELECLEDGFGILKSFSSENIVLRRLLPCQKHKLEKGDQFFLGEVGFLIKEIQTLESQLENFKSFKIMKTKLSSLCPVCENKLPKSVLLPCGHCSACSKCYSECITCPECYVPISKILELLQKFKKYQNKILRLFNQVIISYFVKNQYYL